MKFSRTRVSALLSIITLVASLVACDLDSRDPNFWGKNFMMGNNTQDCYSVKVASDGGFVMAGTLNVYTGDRMGDWIWVAKTDAQGVIKWEKAFGGPSLEQGIEGMSIIQTSDGGYAFVCSTRSFLDPATALNDFGDWVVKLDAQGQVQWQKVYDQELYRGQAKRLIQTTDGGYLLMGGGLVKLDAAGAIQWKNAYTPSDNTFSDVYNAAIEKTDDGGFLMAASAWRNVETTTGETGHEKGLLWKVDASGTLQWQKSLAVRYSCIEFTSVAAAGGAYFVAGRYQPLTAAQIEDNDQDIFVAKFDAAGNLLWQKAYNLGGKVEGAYGIMAASDGGCMVTGETNRFDIGDAVILKLNANGSVAWCKAFDAERARGYEIRATSKGYVIGGFSEGKGALLISVDTNGAIPNAGNRIKAITPGIFSPSLVSGGANLAAQGYEVRVSGTTATVFTTQSTMTQY